MKLVILDRDGVINDDSDDYIKSADEWRPLPGSLEAIAKLNHFGFKVAVATNQSGLARGLFSIDELNAIHHKLHQELDRIGGHLECIVFCPHGPNDGCACRKPKPGLLLQIKERLGVELENVPVIGDSMRDIISAQAVGAYPILVKTGKGHRTLTQNASKLSDIAVLPNLAAAVETILGSDSEK
jgi:D-glycero-D-manno-heptose 1,7-bisphosphate phosphatase